MAQSTTLSKTKLTALRNLLFQNTPAETIVNTNLLQSLNATLINHYGADWQSRFVLQSEEDEIAVRQGKKPAHDPDAIVCTTKGEMYGLICADNRAMPDGFPKEITATADINYDLNNIQYHQIGSDAVAYKRDSINDAVPTLADSDTREIVRECSIGEGSLLQFYTPEAGQTSAGMSAIHHFMNGQPTNSLGSFGEPLPALTYFHKNGEVKETQYISMSYYYQDASGNKVPVDELTQIPPNATLLADSLLQNFIPSYSEVCAIGESNLNSLKAPEYLRALENRKLARAGKNAEEIFATVVALTDLVDDAGHDYVKHITPDGTTIPARQHFDEKGRLVEIGFYDKGGLCDLDYPMGLDSVMYFNPETGERRQRPADVVDPNKDPNKIDLCELEPFSFDPKKLTAKQLKQWEALPSAHHNKDGRPVTNGQYVADRKQREMEDLEKARKAMTFANHSVIPITPPPPVAQAPAKEPQEAEIASIAPRGSRLVTKSAVMLPRVHVPNHENR